MVVNRTWSSRRSSSRWARALWFFSGVSALAAVYWTPRRGGGPVGVLGGGEFGLVEALQGAVELLFKDKRVLALSVL